MRHIVNLKNHFHLRGLLPILWLLVGSALVACGGEKEAPVVVPFAGAPVTATVDGKMLIIANNLDSAVYLRIFPTDILPVIEWAPCIAPETCPDDQRLDPGSEKSIKLRDIVRAQTDSITVFWWIYLEKAPGASIPPMEMDEIYIPLP